jgi:hypothetical protein
MKTKLICAITVIASAVTMLSCAQKQTNSSPIGYNFAKPVKYNVPAQLSEISGIAFSKGKTDRIFAEDDENGRVYYFREGDKTVNFTEFKEKGDFEDITICNNWVVMLQSKGVLFTIPLAEIGKPLTDKAQKNKDLLPEGEYEGMYADEAASQVYVLCKHCTTDKTSKESSGFIFKLASDGSLKQSGNFTVNVKHIGELLGMDKISFHPSALARSPLSNDWYILSSVNKVLVVADAKWKIREVYKLDQNLFTQPEGMAFDSANNLYISNEGHAPQPGNVLKFAYKKP